MTTAERQFEDQFIQKLQSQKYDYRLDIRDRDSLERNFRQKFEALNRVTLTAAEFQCLLEEIITPDVYVNARTLRARESFTRDDGTPLTYTLVNIKDWCKNTFEVQ
jgi:type I restriction enzyme R subunit